ncbi:hypothetical protein GGR54DRAFT_633371 [Hypoxylon sp. NC1633]|nr:hypothetical protein GGR54DRAFT_633371 [Hypoxylon sp. NC1633]
MSTYYIYFPFLTCEVTYGALDVADRQNAHSMTMAVRGVELFRLVKREKELCREILAFSVSHDHREVRICGHYPEIDGKKTTFYRHLIREFSFGELDGEEKWTAYEFTKNSLEDLPPDLDFEVSEQPEPGESLREVADSQLILLARETLAPDVGPGNAFKRQRKGLDP